MPWWFWVGFLLLLMIGIIVIVYYLYGTKQEEGFQTTAPTTGAGPENRQVYVPYQNGNWDQGNEICKSLGGRYATMAELRDALRGGADWNVLGFIGETKKQTYAPQQSPLTSGILSYIPGVENMANRPTIVRGFGGAYGKDTSYKVGLSSEFQSVNCSESGTRYNIDLHGGDVDGLLGGYPICYGVRPINTNDGHSIVNFNGNSVSDPRHTMENLESIRAYNSYTVPGSTDGSVPTTFDRAPTTDTLGSYTILDLEGINVQKSIMQLDVLRTKETAITNEATLATTIASQLPVVNNEGITDILDSTSIISQFLNYMNTTRNSMVANLITQSMLFYNPTGITPPNSTKYTQASLSAQRIKNIKNFYSNILDLLTTNPVAVIQNSIMNEMLYLNGIQPASSMWEISGDYKSKKLSCNGIGSKDYRYGTRQTVVDHCPGGNWCFDSYDTPLIWDGCRSGYNRDEWHGYGGKIGPCIREYFNFRQGLTRVDVDLGARPPTCTYDSSFFSSVDGWQPKTCTSSPNNAIQNSIITTFTNNKTGVASRYGKTSQADIKNTYRWKPVTYYGTVSPTNIAEVQKSIAISIIFNFNSAMLAESQIRISSREPYNLYYSPNGAALPEFTQSPGVSALTNSNAVYNDLYCKQPFTAELLNLLPYQTRQFITNWAYTRKASVRNYYILAENASPEGIIVRQQQTKVETAWRNDYNYHIISRHESLDYGLWSDPNHPIHGYETYTKHLKNPTAQEIADATIFADSKGTIQARLNANATYTAASTIVGQDIAKIIADASGAILDDPTNPLGYLSYAYEQSWFNVSQDQVLNRNAILDQMAQLFYDKKNGNSKIQTIYDIYQVGTTLFDVYYKQIDTGSASPYASSISSLNNEFFAYRKYTMSQAESDALESQYSKNLQALYDLEAQDLEGDAKNCGVKAHYVQIQCPANGLTGSMNLSQVVVIDNTGANVAYGIMPSATSTYLSADEDDTGTIYSMMDNVGSTIIQTDTRSRDLAKASNEAVMRSKLSALTDGTYVPRYYPTWQNGKGGTPNTGPKNLMPSDLDANKYSQYQASYQQGFISNTTSVTKVASASTPDPYEYIELNLYGQYDVSVIQLFYPPSNSSQIPNPNLTVQLFDKAHQPIPTTRAPTTTAGVTINTSPSNGVLTMKSVGYNPSGSTIVDFKRANRDIKLPKCPESIYTNNRVARFYADPTKCARITSANSIVFTGFSEDTTTALTFNPDYNAGFYVRMDSQYGTINYDPTTSFNKNTIPQIAAYDNIDRIQTVFKDYAVAIDSYKFNQRADIKSLTTANHFDQNNVYAVSSVVGGYNPTDANGNKINSVAYYKWYEIEMGQEDRLDMAGNTVTYENTIKNTFLRSGIFVYMRDTQNWKSQNIVYDLSNSWIFKSDRTGISGANTWSLTPNPPNPIHNFPADNEPQIPNFAGGSVKINSPYADSVTLGLNTTCPANCSDPSIINSIITDYNTRKDIPYENGGLKPSGYQDPIIQGGAIIRVDKALTNTSRSCVYEISTMTSGSSQGKTQQVEFSVSPDSNCNYKIINTRLTNQIVSTTPYLTDIYHYITDTMIPYTDTLYNAYATLSTLLLAQADPTKKGITADLIQYRTDTYKSAGQIRQTPLGIINEVSTLCDNSTVQANSPLIINGFLNQYRSEQPDGANYIITQILGVGMTSSLNACDFSYESAPFSISNTGVVTINRDRAIIAGRRASIIRYRNSCAYTIDPLQSLIPMLPVPLLSDVTNPLYTIYNYDSTTTQMGSTITSAGISSVVSTIGAPFKTYEYDGQLLESIDYINCNSLYTISTITANGASITSQKIAQDTISSCIVASATASTVYVFSKSRVASEKTLSPKLYTFSKTVSPTRNPTSPYTTIPTTLPNLATNFSYTPPPGKNICTDNNYQSALTGLTGVVSALSTVSNQQSCDYQISLDYTLPFGEMYKRATFYTGNTATTNGSDVHLLSLEPSLVMSSPYKYFNSTYTPTQIATSVINPTGDPRIASGGANNIFMLTMQYLRYMWNSYFYSDSMDPPPTGWKIGSINNVYVLDTDTVVFDASGCDFGQYGQNDIREYSDQKMFAFDLRYQSTPNSYGFNFSVYKKYILPALPTTRVYSSPINNANRDLITKYQNPTITPASTVDYGVLDKTVYPVLQISTALTATSGNQYRYVRFSVQSTYLSDSIAEITRIMFYKATIAPNGARQVPYTYIDAVIKNPAVATVSDLLANYILSNTGKTACDENYTSTIMNGAVVCKLNQDILNRFSYTPVKYRSNPDQYVACGIGYAAAITSDNTRVCQPTGYYQQVLEDPIQLFNGYEGTARIHLNVGGFENTTAKGATSNPTQTLTVQFQRAIQIDAYSFLTGSAGRAPTGWTLEGSINGINWVVIDQRNSPNIPSVTNVFSYDTANYSTINAPVVYNTNGVSTLNLSFYNPGIFLVNLYNKPPPSNIIQSVSAYAGIAWDSNKLGVWPPVAVQTQPSGFSNAVQTAKLTDNIGAPMSWSYFLTKYAGNGIVGLYTKLYQLHMRGLTGAINPSVAPTTSTQTTAYNAMVSNPIFPIGNRRAMTGIAWTSSTFGVWPPTLTQPEPVSFASLGLTDNNGAPMTWLYFLNGYAGVGIVGLYQQLRTVSGVSGSTAAPTTTAIITAYNTTLGSTIFPIGNDAGTTGIDWSSSVFGNWPPTLAQQEPAGFSNAVSTAKLTDNTGKPMTWMYFLNAYAGIGIVGLYNRMLRLYTYGITGAINPSVAPTIALQKITAYNSMLSNTIFPIGNYPAMSGIGWDPSFFGSWPPLAAGPQPPKFATIGLSKSWNDYISQYSSFYYYYPLTPTSNLLNSISYVDSAHSNQISIYSQATKNITEGFQGGAKPAEKPVPTLSTLSTPTLSTPTLLKESFQAPLLPQQRKHAMEFTAPAVSLTSVYTLPMRQGAYVADMRDTRMNVSKKARIQYLRFITIETYDSNSKFVNMSKLEFHTRKGVVPPACIKLSNSQGSRKSPKDGVNSILGSKSQRWVDYNKSEILIQFDLEILPAEPISGFKFSIPDLEGGLNACPRKWQLLGSYDKHNWKPLHNQEDPVKNPALYTMVHTFIQEI